MKKRLENRGMFYGANAYIFSKAEELRNNPTETESILWREINAGKIGVRFKRQHPINRWIADFYCHQFRLVIEIDSGYHESDQQKEKDAARTSEIESFGITILRFSNDEILNELQSVIEKIKREVNPRNTNKNENQQNLQPCAGSLQGSKGQRWSISM